MVIFISSECCLMFLALNISLLMLSIAVVAVVRPRILNQRNRKFRHVYFPVMFLERICVLSVFISLVRDNREAKVNRCFSDLSSEGNKTVCSFLK